MPALLTHYLCGNRMLQLMADAPIKGHMEKYRNVFNLGTQGPDILFYYGAWPWKKSNGIPKLGDKIHESKTGEFIYEALKYANSSEEESKSLLSAYLCGYLCHYALDCHTHPYIFYRTGFVRKGESPTTKYTCYHRMFETALDVLMLEHELGKSPSEFKASGKIRVSNEAAAVIGEMYSTVLKKVYDENIDSHIISQAIADIANISAALKDSTGIKRLLLASVEKCLGRQPMFSSMILPRRISDGRDYLNLKHSTWQLPWDSSRENTASFPEMFEAAAAEAMELCTHILFTLYNNENLKQAMIPIGNRSFSTGIDCNQDAEFVYYDCIYE